MTTRAPLYHRYPSQITPQPAHLELDCRHRDISADWNSEVGNGVPVAVWHRHILRFPLPPQISQDSLDELTDSPKLSALAMRIFDGYSSEWDGNNHVARYTDDAIQAQDALTALCEQYNNPDCLAAVWEVGDWLEPSITRHADRLEVGGETIYPDTDVTEIAARLEASAVADDVVLDGSVADYLAALRDEIGDAE